MPLARNVDNKITLDEYLNGELTSDIKHEYIDGYVYAMSGASKKHNLISGNVFYGFGNELRQKKSPCNTFTSDMKVRSTNITDSYFYPDVMVVCDRNKSDNEYYQNSPLIIVEVLSKSTEKFDKSNKRLSYFNIPSLKEYVLIEQDKCEVVVFEKDKGWQSSYYFLGDEISFQSIQITLTVEDIYYQVDNEDFIAFLKEKEEKL